MKQYSTNLAGLRSAASFGYGAGFGAPWTVVDFGFGRVFLVIQPHTAMSHSVFDIDHL